MYLNYFSEHPMSLKKSIPYSQFLRLKKIHSETQYLLESQIHLYLYFRWREYPHDIILQAWTDTNKFIREQLLETVDNTAKDLPLMFITTYNRASPNFNELISRHWAYLGRSSAIRDFEQKKFMVTYRRPPSLKDQLVRARITQPTHPTTHGCKRPNSCKYCKKISQSGTIKNTLNNKNYNTMKNGTCQSNNPIYCIECNWCQTKYVGQTRNRIIQISRSYI